MSSSSIDYVLNADLRTEFTLENIVQQHSVPSFSCKKKSSSFASSIKVWWNRNVHYQQKEQITNSSVCNMPGELHTLAASKFNVICFGSIVKDHWCLRFVVVDLGDLQSASIETWMCGG